MDFAVIVKRAAGSGRVGGGVLSSRAGAGPWFIDPITDRAAAAAAAVNDV